MGKSGGQGRRHFSAASTSIRSVDRRFGTAAFLAEAAVPGASGVIAKG